MIGYIENNQMFEKSCHYSDLEKVLKCPSPLNINTRKEIVRRTFFLFSNLNSALVIDQHESWSISFEAIIFPQPLIMPLQRNKLEVIDGEVKIELPVESVFEEAGLTVELSIGSKVLKCDDMIFSEDRLKCNLKVYNTSLYNLAGTLGARIGSSTFDLGSVTLFQPGKMAKIKQNLFAYVITGVIFFTVLILIGYQGLKLLFKRNKKNEIRFYDRHSAKRSKRFKNSRYSNRSSHTVSVQHSHLNDNLSRQFQ